MKSFLIDDDQEKDGSDSDNDDVKVSKLRSSKSSKKEVDEKKKKTKKKQSFASANSLVTKISVSQIASGTTTLIDSLDGEKAARKSCDVISDEHDCEAVSLSEWDFKKVFLHKLCCFC